jgi:hypothetical protein
MVEAWIPGAVLFRQRRHWATSSRRARARLTMAELFALGNLAACRFSRWESPINSGLFSASKAVEDSLGTFASLLFGAEPGRQHRAGDKTVGAFGYLGFKGRRASPPSSFFNTSSFFNSLRRGYPSAPSPRAGSCRSRRRTRPRPEIRKSQVIVGQRRETAHNRPLRATRAG